MINIIVNKSNELKNKNGVQKKDKEKFELDCNKCLADINNKMKKCIESFNNVSLELSNTMIKLLPDDKDTMYANKLLTELIKFKPTEPISLFIEKVYSNDEYRRSIKIGDDLFFLEKSHDDITNGNTDKINKLFKFKEYWNDFDIDVKNIIKNMMKVLVNLTAKYIEEMDNGNTVALILKNI